MTDRECVDLLRPHLKRVVEAVQSGKVPTNGNGKHGSVWDGDPEKGEFTVKDLPQFFNYFAPSSDGAFPGHVHTFFQATPKVFADATGLRRVNTPSGWVWSK